MVVCLEQGADLHMAQLMPLPLIVSCFSKIQIGFTFLVLAQPGSPGQRAVKWACVCVCAKCADTHERTLPGFMRTAALLGAAVTLANSRRCCDVVVPTRPESSSQRDSDLDLAVTHTQHLKQTASEQIARDVAPTDATGVIDPQRHRL